MQDRIPSDQPCFSSMRLPKVIASVCVCEHVQQQALRRLVGLLTAICSCTVAQVLAQAVLAPCVLIQPVPSSACMLWLAVCLYAVDPAGAVARWLAMTDGVWSSDLPRKTIPCLGSLQHHAQARCNYVLIILVYAGAMAFKRARAGSVTKDASKPVLTLSSPPPSTPAEGSHKKMSGLAKMFPLSVSMKKASSITAISSPQHGATV